MGFVESGTIFRPTDLASESYRRCLNDIRELANILLPSSSSAEGKLTEDGEEGESERERAEGGRDDEKFFIVNATTRREDQRRPINRLRLVLSL